MKNFISSISQRSKQFLIILVLLSSLPVHSQIFYAGTKPGKATGVSAKNTFELKNAVLNTQLQYAGNKITMLQFKNIISGEVNSFDCNKLFSILLDDSTRLGTADFQIKKISMPTLSCKEKKRSISTLLYNSKNKITINWEIALKDDANYIQQKFIFDEGNASKRIEKLILIQLDSSEQPKQSGIVDGSPLLSGRQFFSIENPMSKVDSTTTGLKQYIYRSSTISNNNHSFLVSVVFGVTPKEQLRRGYTYYLEKERARAYSPYLHYNSWYDLSFDKLMLNETDCLDRIQTWSDSLTVKRGIKVDGYLWDSGWDNYDNLWHYNSGLPNGFKKMYTLSKKYGSGMGVWISPWGGYDQEKLRRLASVKNHIPTYETNESGFSLSGPHYFEYFKSVVTNFVEQNGVSAFKFDGVGAGLKATGAGPKYQKDIEAFFKIISYLRQIKPDIYLSLTVGTWPSPYWLQYGDNIWRGGGDYSFIGKGNKRQRSINYRDGDTYENIVLRSKFFPLNAVMNHGIIIAPNGGVALTDIDLPNITDDIWMFFASGTSLQEMYINPHELTSEGWDILAKAIKWTQQNKSALTDVHWVGGDPRKSEIYGFASWNPKQATLALRNPSDSTQLFTNNLAEMLELPSEYNGKYELYNAITDETKGVFDSKQKLNLTLKPFETLVMSVISQ